MDYDYLAFFLDSLLKTTLVEIIFGSGYIFIMKLLNKSKISFLDKYLWLAISINLFSQPLACFVHTLFEWFIRNNFTRIKYNEYWIDIISNPFSIILEIFNIILFMLIYDFMYYHLHRQYHRNTFLFKIHKLHHMFKESAESMNPFVAHANHPFDTVLSATCFHVGLFICSLTYDSYLFISLMSWAWSFYLHTTDLHIKSNYFMTSDDHNEHHDAYMVNYGLTFKFFDQMFGTYRERRIMDKT